MNFLQTLYAILQNHDDIPILPQLISFERDGVIVSGNFSQDTLRMLIRLQTLLMDQHDDGAMPQHNIGEDVVFMANQLVVHEDIKARAIMIERLMTEIIRDVAPLECDHFGVRYHVNIDLMVIRSMTPKQRFLD